MAKMVDINDIPVGSKFIERAKDIELSKEDIEKANKWWNSLPEISRLKIYQDIQEALHGHWNEDAEKKEEKNKLGKNF